MRLSVVASQFAERQLGLVTRRQLVAAGVSPNTIAAGARRGQLHRMAPGVYRLPGTPDTTDNRLLARVLAAGEDAVLSHRSAAWLWGLLPPPRRHAVSVPWRCRPRARDLEVHRSTDLDRAIIGAVRGLPVTGVGRTILDCAGDADIDLDLLVDEARRTLDISRTLLPATVVAHARSGRPGITRLRDLVIAAELPASDFERLVGRWLRDHRVTGWELHHRIVVPGFGPVELDFAWPDRCVALELEGADHRDRTTVHDRDTARQNRLVLAGYTVVRVTYRRWLRHPAEVLAELTGVLAAAPTDARRA